MSFAVEACIVKPVSQGYELCISGVESDPEARLALRINDQLVPASFGRFSVPANRGCGQVVRVEVPELPDHVDILEDGQIAWTSKARDLRSFDGISFSIAPAPAKQGIYVHGWCFYDGSTPVSAQVYDSQGREVPVFRSSLPDLEDQYALHPIRPGFSFALPDEAGSLVLSWNDQKRTIDLKPHLHPSLSYGRLRQGLAYFRRNGLAALWQKSQNLQPKEPEPEGYHAWYERQAPAQEELAMQQATRFSRDLKISLAITLQDPDLQAVSEMIQSVQQQTYQNWQLCISLSDQIELPEEKAEEWKKDERIRLIPLTRHLGQAAALNEALACTDGDYVAFLGQEDLLASQALYEVARRLQIRQGQIVYADEDQYNDLTHTLQNPWFKPDFSPDLLRGMNYMGRFVVMDSMLAKTLGGFMAQYEGAQLYDLILRAIDETAETGHAGSVIHIPQVLSHLRWRPGSENVPLYQLEAQTRALASHLARMHLQGSASLMQQPWPRHMEISLHLRQKPMISVISMTRDPQRLQILLESLRKDGYGHYEVISPNPGRSLPDGMEALNAAAAGAHGELLLFLEENTIPAQPGTLEALAARMQMPGTSMVAGRLLDPDNLVLALGYVYQNRKILPRFGGLHANEAGYMDLAQLSGNVSITPFDGVLFRKSDLLAHHGLDRSLGQAAWADFCLSLPGRIAVTPRISFVAQKAPLTPSSLELDLLARRHPAFGRSDPYYNSGFAGQTEVYGTSFA